MTTRRRRAGVEDRWTKADGTESASHGGGRRWRARYVDDRGREHAKGFDRKVDAQRWLDGQTAAIVDGRHIAPRDAQITMSQWCQRWFEGYQVNRPHSIRVIRTYIREIETEFGHLPLSVIEPLDVKTWLAKLHNRGLSANYISSLHSKLKQILADAVHNKLLASNPCSRRTSPPTGKQKPYCATDEQVWALHDAMPEHLRPAILLGAFAGLRISEACGLRVADVDFMHGVVHPKQQYGGGPLKTPGCDAPIPIPRDLSNLLASSVARYGTEWMVTNGNGGPCRPNTLGEAIAGKRRNDPGYRRRDGVWQAAYSCITPGARDRVDGLPATFTFHDLRHYFASMLIAEGNHIKTVQAAMRHATAQMTLDTYGHLLPDADESTRAAIGKVIRERIAAGG
jgi:integrase